MASKERSLNKLAKLLKLDDSLRSQLLASYNYSFAEEEYKLRIWTDAVEEILTSLHGCDCVFTPGQIITVANDLSRECGSFVGFSSAAIGDVCRGLANKNIIVNANACCEHANKFLWLDTSRGDFSVSAQKLCGRQQTDIVVPLKSGSIIGNNSPWLFRLGSWLMSFFSNAETECDSAVYSVDPMPHNAAAAHIHSSPQTQQHHHHHMQQENKSYTDTRSMLTFGETLEDRASGVTYSAPYNYPIYNDDGSAAASCHPASVPEKNVMIVRREFSVPFVDVSPSTDCIEESESLVFLPILENLAAKFLTAVNEGSIHKMCVDQPTLAPTTSSSSSSSTHSNHHTASAASTIIGTFVEAAPLASASCFSDEDFNVDVACIRRFLDDHMQVPSTTEKHVEMFLWYLTFYTGVARPYVCSLGLLDAESEEEEAKTRFRFVKISPHRSGAKNDGLLKVLEEDKAAAFEATALRRLNRRLANLCDRLEKIDAKCRLFVRQENKKAALMLLQQKHQLQEEISQVTQHITQVEAAAQMRDSVATMTVVASVLKSSVAAAKGSIPDKMLDVLSDTISDMDEVREVQSAFAEGLNGMLPFGDEVNETLKAEMQSLEAEIAAQDKAAVQRDKVVESAPISENGAIQVFGVEESNRFDAARQTATTVEAAGVATAPQYDTSGSNSVKEKKAVNAAADMIAV